MESEWRSPGCPIPPLFAQCPSQQQTTIQMCEFFSFTSPHSTIYPTHRIKSPTFPSEIPCSIFRSLTTANPTTISSFPQNLRLLFRQTINQMALPKRLPFLRDLPVTPKEPPRSLRPLASASSLLVSTHQRLPQQNGRATLHYEGQWRTSLQNCLSRPRPQRQGDSPSVCSKGPLIRRDRLQDPFTAIEMLQWNVL